MNKRETLGLADQLRAHGSSAVYVEHGLDGEWPSDYRNRIMDEAANQLDEKDARIAELTLRLASATDVIERCGERGMDEIEINGDWTSTHFITEEFRKYLEAQDD